MADLPPQAQQLIEQRQLEASLTPQGWLDLFASVEQANAERKGFKKMFSRKKELPPTVTSFVLPLMRLLREDMEGDAQVSLRIDLRTSQLVNESKPQVQKPITKIVDRTYFMPWLGGGAVLADGASLQWSVADTQREVQRTKRNPRGKIKKKTKIKKRSQVDVWLTLPHKRYRLARHGPATEVKKLNVKEGDKRDKVHVRRVLKDVQGPVPLEALSTALREAYAQARPRGGRARPA